jgi:hypothetical protein
LRRETLQELPLRVRIGSLRSIVAHRAGIGAQSRLISPKKALAVENIRLPFLGPGWFHEALRAGAVKDAAGWYLPPNAVVPAALRAHIDAAQPQNRREAPPIRRSDVVGAIAVAAPVGAFAVSLDPELQEILAHSDPDDAAQRSAVIADWYRVKVEKLLSRPGSLNGKLSGREWVQGVLDRAEAGDPKLSMYAVSLARAVKGRA